MRGFLKMCALSAALSVTLVTAYNQAWSSQAAPAAGKPYQDRLPESAAAAPDDAGRTGAVAAVAGRKGDRLQPGAACANQTWPYIAPTCLVRADGAAKAVRVITVEERPAPNTSVLVRVPQAAVASR